MAEQYIADNYCKPKNAEDPFEINNRNYKLPQFTGKRNAMELLFQGFNPVSSSRPT